MNLARMTTTNQLSFSQIFPCFPWVFNQQFLTLTMNEHTFAKGNFTVHNLLARWHRSVRTTASHKTTHFLIINQILDTLKNCGFFNYYLSYPRDQTCTTINDMFPTISNGYGSFMLPSMRLLLGCSCCDGSDTRDTSPFARMVGDARKRLLNRPDCAVPSSVTRLELARALSSILSKPSAIVRANFLGYLSVYWDLFTRTPLSTTDPSMGWCWWFWEHLHPWMALKTLCDVVLTIMLFFINSLLWGFPKSKLTHVKFSSKGLDIQFLKKWQTKHHGGSRLFPMKMSLMLNLISE